VSKCGAKGKVCQQSYSCSCQSLGHHSPPYPRIPTKLSWQPLLYLMTYPSALPLLPFPLFGP
jgi:hypothetical protein